MKKLANKKRRLIRKKARKDLCADALYRRVRLFFTQLPDTRKGNAQIVFSDFLMSVFAMFILKDESLRALDGRRQDDNPNFLSIFGINRIPSDTRAREVLDDFIHHEFSPLFKEIFHIVQRGKVLESMVFMDGCYLLSLDGTEYFSSKKLSNDSCMTRKNKETGEVESYYQQLLAAVIVHPDQKVVLPLFPEPIVKQDGSKKNDCERNAAKRFLGRIRKDHPRLPLIIVEDGLGSNAPHIGDIEEQNMHYIIGVKPGDHQFLFNYVDEAVEKKETIEFECVDEKDEDVHHFFRFLNDVPLNKSNQDLRVNFIEYWEAKGDELTHFSWVTDFTVTEENVYQLMRGGRARWKVENEGFNTLKNQGYHFGHNFGLGEKNLSLIFVMIMMLAFFVDQIQQLTCGLFQAVKEKLGSKKELWNRMRGLFQNFRLDSMEMLFRALFYGYERHYPDIFDDS